MRYVLGLGNPGTEYKHTRHNAGFDALDKVAAFFQVNLKKRCFFPYLYSDVPGGKIVKPLTYMNRSGNIIRRLDKNISPDCIAVICDNMDLGVGGLKIKKGGGTGGQKGLISITENLESGDFVKIYVGTGRPMEGVSVNEHVLGRETDPDKIEAYNQALEAACKAAVDFINGVDLVTIQCRYNRKGLF